VPELFFSLLVFLVALLLLFEWGVNFELFVLHLMNEVTSSYFLLD